MADRPVKFVALGGVWLDEIRTAGEVTKTDVLGGSVTFATLGARLFAATNTASIRLIFFAGHDFPQGHISLFRSWQIALTIHYSDSLPSARGVIQYDGMDESRRTYQRLTAPLPLTWEHLTISDISNATCFHLFETPEAAAIQVHEVLSRRTNVADRPIFIWEPQGKSCNTHTLDRHLHAASLMDVFSPNHAELDSLFEEDASLIFDRDRVEAQAKYFMDAGVGHGNQGCIVVRCAERGCLIMSQDMAPTWLPAFYDAGSEHVVDATGGGNAFLGGFSIGYQETGSFIEAAKYGNVAASFAIEQVGVAKLSVEGEYELWNGQKVRDRLAVYQDGLKSSNE
ncbi:related to pfkB family carbohydrate kinase superfamily [Ramularia collo-cygni]|uniref:Related to pfkB family carbohydrate kinase superfamily n=1 Tax=Ramularia collo-cygni TaxID=112498 RepID=A0A2D3UN23_9PEZI|nr:related to pfkB family carbohydrate kinase superfamily [Ramularia collo-cygni]CZT14548.1 related to pfkB family carbohydrate kinase superfamily [Ramularia collo-cygni]